jgi:hypothetical protein
VGLEGPARCLPKFNYLIRPGTITVRFGAPIPTAGRGVTDKGELIEVVRNALERLRGNTKPGAAVAFHGDVPAGSVADGH